MLVGATVVLCLQLSSSMHMQFRHTSESQFRLTSQIKLFQNIKEKSCTSVNYSDGSVCLESGMSELIEIRGSECNMQRVLCYFRTTHR